MLGRWPANSGDRQQVTVARADKPSRSVAVRRLVEIGQAMGGELFYLIVIAGSVLFMYARGTSQETLLYFIIGFLDLLGGVLGAKTVGRDGRGRWSD